MLSPASPPSEEDWARLDKRVARTDEDRWISSRYAPLPQRRALVALYAFNVELARVRTIVSEPTLGAIRFQWWREALSEIEAGAPVRKHDVAQALAACIQHGHYAPKGLQRLVDGHEDAFEQGERSLEPEALLMLLAAAVLADSHGWGERIQQIAPVYGAARRGDSQAFGPILPRVPAPLRPAMAHARLRRHYINGKAPGPMARRLSVLRAIMTGQI